MALRGVMPSEISAKRRLKMLMYGAAGVGKTTAAIQFRQCYVIDCERGAENYGEQIAASGGAYFQAADAHDVLQEVRSLGSDRHPYRTVVIDPVTTFFGALVDACEDRVGVKFGRHVGEANKVMRRLMAALTALDMNVILTCHAKTEYGDDQKAIGTTFEGWKSLDYLVDLAVEISRTQEFSLKRNAKGAADKRWARVVKTRLAGFPDRAVFPWSYDEVAERYGRDRLEEEASCVALPTEEELRLFHSLLRDGRAALGQLPALWLEKAKVADFADMPQEKLLKCIEFAKARVAERRQAEPTEDDTNERQ